MMYVIIGIIVVILIIASIIFFKYMKLKEIEEVVLICSSNIMEVLDRKEKEILSILDNIKDDKIKNLYIINKDETIFEKEDMLFELAWNINKYLDGNNDKNSLTYEKNIDSVDEELEGLKDYYNLNAVSYNELYNKKPFVYIFKLFKLNSKRVFKLRKLESYEILKD